MATEQVLRSIPEIGVDFPSGHLMEAAFTYAQKHCPEEVNNHVARTAYWALILTKKLPEFSTSRAAAARPVNIEDVVLICLLHDLGLATWIFESSDGQDASSNPFPGLLSLDKRFEVDCANIARAFVETETHKTEWDDARLDHLWTAIALHASPSFARHAPAPEIALAHLAIEADFFGPYWSPTCTQPPPPPSGGEEKPQHEEEPIITVEEYRAVTALFPRGDFARDGVQRKLCALCRRKPDTTYDNFVGLFGKEFGCDRQGAGKEEFTRQWEMRQSPMFLLQALDRLDVHDTN